MDVNVVAQRVTKVLERYAVVIAAYLFGSAAQSCAHGQSDLDIAVLLDKTVDANAPLDLRLELMETLQQETGRPVDVVVLNEAPPLLRFQVFRHGQLLLVRDDIARCLFEMHSLNLYYDFQPYHAFQVACLLDRIRKEGLGVGYHGARDALAEARRLSQTLEAAAEGRA